MATRTVRLDEETDRMLQELADRTGRSVSSVLREGILALTERRGEEAPRRPWEIYSALDLGPGGYAVAPSTETRRGVREALTRKRSR